MQEDQAKGSVPARKPRKRNIIPQSIKDDFLNREILVCDLVDLTAAQEEDHFSRVQKGLALTPAEQLRATTGPWQKLAALYMNDFRPVFSRMNPQHSSEMIC